MHLTVQQLSASLDGALHGPSQEHVVRHLAGCHECRDRQARLVKHDDALRRLLSYEPDEQRLDELMRRCDAIATAVVGGQPVPPIVTSRPLLHEEGPDTPDEPPLAPPPSALGPSSQAAKAAGWGVIGAKPTVPTEAPLSDPVDARRLLEALEGDGLGEFTELPARDASEGPDADGPTFDLPAWIPDPSRDAKARGEATREKPAPPPSPARPAEPAASRSSEADAGTERAEPARADGDSAALRNEAAKEPARGARPADGTARREPAASRPSDEPPPPRERRERDVVGRSPEPGPEPAPLEPVREPARRAPAFERLSREAGVPAVAAEAGAGRGRAARAPARAFRKRDASLVVAVCSVGALVGLVVAFQFAPPPSTRAPGPSEFRWHGLRLPRVRFMHLEAILAPAPAPAHVQSSATPAPPDRAVAPGTVPRDSGTAHRDTLVAGAPSPADADSASSGGAADKGEPGWPVVCGTVVDASGRPVAGAWVSVVEPGLAVRTDPQGRFCVSAPEGKRSLVVDAAGFRTLRRDVAVTAETAELKLKLLRDH